MDKPQLEALKAANPIQEAARNLGLEVVRNRFRCLRAERHVHGDRTPSVTVSPERGTFKCWVCPDVKGDVIDLVRLVRGCGFTEAVAYLEGRASSPPFGSARKESPGGAGISHESAPSRTARSRDLPQTELFQDPKTAAGIVVPKISSSRPSPVPANAGDRSIGIEALLELCAPVRGKAAAWLKSRRIFKKIWDAQELRVVEDYRRTGDGLRERFSMEQLQAWGLFNADGHLRFYRHSLLLPYFDALNADGVVDGSTDSLRPVYLQARALETDVQPKELSLAGSVPCPYNARMLNGEAARLYLCEGVIDTLSLLEAGFPAVGVPGALNFKPAWIPRFRNKSVYVAFDADAAGEAGATKVIAQFTETGIEAHRLLIPAGKDINDWLRGGK